MQEDSHAARATHTYATLCCPRFRRYRSVLFGLPLAVLACNRLPMLMQAIVRRLFCVMVSLCFDNFAQQDWADLATRARDIVGHFFSVCGFPLAPENHQSPSATGDSLGLLPDVSSLRSTGRIRLWVRQHLVDKIQDIVNTLLSTGSLTPGQAVKHPSFLGASPVWIMGFWPCCQIWFGFNQRAPAHEGRCVYHTRTSSGVRHGVDHFADEARKVTRPACGCLLQATPPRMGIESVPGPSC